MPQRARLELEADSSQIKTATSELKTLETQGTKTEKATKQMATSANNANKALGGVGRSAGQVGIQVQQLVGQIQGGQNAFQAFGAQAADIGIVMGAPLVGVIFAFAAAIAGTLLPSLFDAEEGVEDLTGALRRLATQQQLTAEQAAILSEAEGRKVAENLEERAKLTKQLTQAEALASRQRGAIATAGTDAEETERYNKALQENLAEQNKLRVALVVVNKEIENGTKNIITYNNNIGDGSESTQTMNDRVSRLTESLTAQKVALEQGELQGQLYAAAQATGVDSVDDLDAGIKKLITDLYNAKQAKLNDAQAAKEAAAITAKAAREQAAAVAKAAREEAAAIREKNQIQSSFDTLSTTLTGEQGGAAGRVQQEYEQRLAIITQYEKSIGAEVGTLEAERLLAFQSFEKKKTDITTAEAEKRKQLELQSNQSMLGATADLFGNLADIAKEGGEKSFNDYKNFASAQAALNAALAITNVLGSPFTTLNPIAGAALATSIGALAGVQVAKIQSQEYSGFEQGGYTGSYGTKEVAGVVHGQEFVVNAPNTKKNRATLEAMNRGEDISKMGAGNTVVNQDTFAINVVSASDKQIVESLVNNSDLIYNIVKRAKRAQGVAF